MNHGDIWGVSIQGQGNSKCKGPGSVDTQGVAEIPKASVAKVKERSRKGRERNNADKI